MAVVIEEEFQVEAPWEDVWAYVSDPPRVVPCLPGAELTEVVDEQTYEGKVRIQVGPVVAQYQGTVMIENIDAASGTLTLMARGTQVGAAGRAEARVTSTLQSLGDMTTGVKVSAEVDVTGRLAQFGGGMIQNVAKEIFREFVGCAREQISAEQGQKMPTESLSPRGQAGGGAPDVARSDKPVNVFLLGGRILLRTLLGVIASTLRTLLRLVDRLQRGLRSLSNLE